MSRGGKHSKVDRVLELFAEKRLYQTINKPVVALLVELILSTGATPIDIIGIQAEHVNIQTRTLTLHPQKKKQLPTTTHQLSEEAISTFLDLEKKKSLSKYSIRRLQQLLKEEMKAIGSELTTPRSLRAAFLSQAYSTPQQDAQTTQLTSIQQRVILSAEDQQKLLEGDYSQKKKRLLLTLLHTGLRVSELLALGPQHIQGKKLVITKDIAHNKIQRILPLPKILTSYVTKHPYLFSSKTTPLTQRRFEQICKEVAQELSISELSPSILRATAIYELSKQLDQETLQLQTGLRSSTLYTHGFLASPQDTTTSQEEDREDDVKTIKQHEEGADAFMYHRSKLRDGGDTDE